jgi:hypothetical protein
MASLTKLNAAVNAMMNRLGGAESFSTDQETVKTLAEMKQNMETVYNTGRTGIISIIHTVKCFDQFCMLGDLARYICAYIDLDEEYARIKDMPEVESTEWRLKHLERDIAWLWEQIPNYNKPAAELDYEAICAYYEYPAPYPEAKITLKIYQISSWDSEKGSHTHSEVQIIAQCKAYYKEYNVASYDQYDYDKSELVKAVTDAISTARNEVEPK